MKSTKITAKIKNPYADNTSGIFMAVVLRNTSEKRWLWTIRKTRTGISSPSEPSRSAGRQHVRWPFLPLAIPARPEWREIFSGHISPVSWIRNTPSAQALDCTFRPMKAIRRKYDFCLRI